MTRPTLTLAWLQRQMDARLVDLWEIIDAIETTQLSCDPADRSAARTLADGCGRLTDHWRELVATVHRIADTLDDGLNDLADDIDDDEVAEDRSDALETTVAANDRGAAP